jgi:hypothetical protein
VESIGKKLKLKIYTVEVAVQAGSNVPRYRE